MGQRSRALIIATVLFLTSCGGNSGGGSDQTPVVDLTAGQVSNQLSADLSPSAETFAVGGATSGKTCSAALSAARSSAARRISACKLAELAFADASNITFNTDYRATGSDYIGTDSTHTGVDLQGHPKPSNSRIVAMLAGNVVGINDSYGEVIVQTRLSDGSDVQIGYMHMRNIGVVIGQTIAKGAVLGIESGKGPTGNSHFAAHLHIELRRTTMPASTVLATAPTSGTWSYALDPLSYADAIYAQATGDNSATPVSGSAPAVPTNLSPGTISSPGSVLPQSTNSISWNSSPGATSYDIGVRDLLSGLLIVNQTVAVNSVSLPVLGYSTQYRWNLRACNQYGCSTYSPLQYFQTEARATASLTCTGSLGTSYNIGQSESVSCPSGQTGAQSRTCQSGGTWGGTTGTCAAPATCTGANGAVFSNGQSESLSCPTGQTGSQLRTCQSNGAWGATTGSCSAPIACAGTNGGTYSIGQSESLSCPIGQTGIRSHTCQSNGSWGTTTGTCTAPVTCSGTNGGTYSVGQAENLSCPAGQLGSQTHTCQSNGSWGATTGTCTAPVVCAGTNGGTYSIGQSESLSCPIGQTGAQSHTCQSNGSWSLTTGTCSAPITCTGTNGGNYSVGQTENLSCPVGQNGSQSHTCQANGNWGLTTGSCIAPQISLASAAKTGALARNYLCASGSATCVQAGITLSGANMLNFNSVRVTWTGSTGNGTYDFPSNSSQITSRTDTSIVIWPTVFDGGDPVGTCYTWTFSVTKGTNTTAAVVLSTGQICRPSGV
jgi:murein DD-endopeptidase MepM/ murein hydrolase activator NlpD